MLFTVEIWQFVKSNILSVVLGIIALILWKNWSKPDHFSRLPPGPAPVPLVGNLLHIDVKEPYTYYLELAKKYGSVFTIWLSNKPAVVISGYEALKDALVTQGDDFSGRANYPLLMRVTRGYGVLASSGHRWRELRRFSIMTMKNFGMGRRSIEKRIQEEARCLVKAFEEPNGGTFNPKQLLYNAVSNVTCSIVFGHRFEYHDPQFHFLCKAVDTCFSFLSSPFGQIYNSFPKIVDFFPGPHRKMFEMVNKAQGYVKEQALNRLKKLNTSSIPEDYIDAFIIRMIQEKDKPNSEFSYDNLLSSAWNLFSAGTETTSSTMRHMLLIMMKYPEVQERVHKEIDEVIGPDRPPMMEDRVKMPYTDAVVHEVQRSMDLAPTAVPHKVMRDTEFHNYHIPEGTLVLPLISSVLADPQLWKNPNHFDPENFLDDAGHFQKNDAFLAFGLGKRVCLGEGLARMELFLFFTSLMQRFTFVGIEPPEEIDITPSCCSFGRLPRSYECYAKLRVQE
uniref:Cytochrome P450 2M1-like n=1 Tax=Denticeps clupeoides TaxID=299321 RepID=A0AAY4D1I6_9TELE